MARKKPVPKIKTFLSHPAAYFVLLCVGVLLFGCTFNIDAATLSISAKVSDPAPPAPATITLPTAGAHFTVAPITVVGTCPPDSYVKLYRNDTFSGLALCSSIKIFQIKTDLFAGSNTLVAKVYNFTDDKGPASAPVTVFYDVPTASPVSNSSQPTPPTQGEKQLTFKTDFLYGVYYTGQTVSWKLNVTGGLPPYAISIDWGDKQVSTISQEKSGSFIIKHKYAKPGGYKHSYTIHVKARDTEGHVTNLQLFMIVRPAAGTVAPTAQVPTQQSPFYMPKRSWLKYLWPAYGVVILMIISFWLGEKEEFLRLKKPIKLPHRKT